MDYTKSDGRKIIQGKAMHAYSPDPATRIEPSDLNSITWSMMEVVKAANETPQAFDHTKPSTFKVFLTALKKLFAPITHRHDFTEIDGTPTFEVGAHSHTEYALKVHTHSAYSLRTHTHTEYAAKLHSHLWGDIGGKPELITGMAYMSEYYPTAQALPAQAVFANSDRSQHHSGGAAVYQNGDINIVKDCYGSVELYISVAGGTVGQRCKVQLKLIRNGSLSVLRTIDLPDVISSKSQAPKSRQFKFKTGDVLRLYITQTHSSYKFSVISASVDISPEFR